MVSVEIHSFLDRASTAALLQIEYFPTLVTRPRDAPRAKLSGMLGSQHLALQRHDNYVIIVARDGCDLSGKTMVCNKAIAG